MPDTDSKTASAQPNDSASAGKPAKPPTGTQTPLPIDRVQVALVEAVTAIVEGKPDAVVKGIHADLTGFLSGLIPPRTIPKDTCDDPDPNIAQYCFALSLSRQQAANTYDTANDNALNGLRTALGTWRAEVSAFQFAIAGANSTLRQAVTAAVNTYKAKVNDDSHSRNYFLYFTMKLAVADAIQAFEGTAEGARATLAGAAGALLASYEAYVDALNTAQSQFLVDEATADQTFWQSVEGVLDAV